MDGTRAYFSNTGSYLSLTAPGTTSSPASPRPPTGRIASVLEQSATGDGWNPQLGWGALNAAAAVELARVTPGKALLRVKRSHRRP
jgi:subtilisin family serine protease